MFSNLYVKGIKIKPIEERCYYRNSPILMAFPGAEVLELTEEGIRSVSYKETEHYIITRRFLEAPERMLHELFE